MSDRHDYDEELKAAPLRCANAQERIADALEVIADCCKYSHIQQLDKTVVNAAALCPYVFPRLKSPDESAEKCVLLAGHSGPHHSEDGMEASNAR